MIRFLVPLLILCFAPAPGNASSHQSPPTLVLVVGAPGEDDYGREFRDWAGLWIKAATVACLKQIVIGLDSLDSSSDRDRLQQTLADELKDSPEPLWLVLIGHGTFDGKEAKFNLRGPDLTVADCVAWLQPFKRTLAVINCSASSAPFLAQLSGPNRVVVTATRSGFEQNYARFGRFFAEALTSPSADLDKDDQVSLLEAFLFASDRVAEFYASEGRLATEHALFDDNGDGRGTPPDWFRGVRAIKKASDGAEPDGPRAHLLHLIRSPQDLALTPEQRARRDQLELALSKLRDQKLALAEDEYFRQLEELLLQIAEIYELKPAAKAQP